MDKTFQWLVIGAGPAGIAAVGKLIDHKIPGDQIGWLDPAFGVGDLGAKCMYKNNKYHSLSNPKRSGSSGTEIIRPR